MDLEPSSSQAMVTFLALATEHASPADSTTACRSIEHCTHS